MWLALQIRGLLRVKTRPAWFLKQDCSIKTWFYYTLKNQPCLKDFNMQEIGSKTGLWASIHLYPMILLRLDSYSWTRLYICSLAGSKEFYFLGSRWVVVNHTAVTTDTHVVDCECKRIKFGLGVWLVNKNMWNRLTPDNNHNRPQACNSTV